MMKRQSMLERMKYRDRKIEEPVTPIVAKEGKMIKREAFPRRTSQYMPLHHLIFGSYKCIRRWVAWFLGWKT
jgi:hypothetical protein